MQTWRALMDAVFYVKFVNIESMSGVQFQNIVCNFMRNCGASLSLQLRSDILCFEIAR